MSSQEVGHIGLYCMAKIKYFPIFTAVVERCQIIAHYFRGKSDNNNTACMDILQMAGRLEGDNRLGAG